jgi:hypothetical protein
MKLTIAQLSIRAAITMLAPCTSDLQSASSLLSQHSWCDLAHCSCRLYSGGAAARIYLTLREPKVIASSSCSLGHFGLQMSTTFSMDWI